MPTRIRITSKPINPITTQPRVILAGGNIYITIEFSSRHSHTQYILLHVFRNL